MPYILLLLAASVLAAGQTGSPADGQALAKILPLTHIEDSVESTPGTGIIVFEVAVAELWVSETAKLGLSQFFGTATPANDLMRKEKSQNELTQLSRRFTNVILDLGPMEFYAGKCSSNEADRIFNLLRTSMHVDVLSCPKVTTTTGREAIISVTDTRTIATGPENADSPFSTAPTGQSIRLLGALDGDSLLLEASGSSMRFHGYAEPGRKIRSKGKMVWLPEPQLQLTVVGARAELKPDEVLLLGTPVRAQIVETVERMRWLGAIPLLGDEFFTKRERQTNLVRQLFIIRPRMSGSQKAEKPLHMYQKRIDKQSHTR